MSEVIPAASVSIDIPPEQFFILENPLADSSVLDSASPDNEKPRDTNQLFQAFNVSAPHLNSQSDPKMDLDKDEEKSESLSKKEKSESVSKTDIADAKKSEKKGKKKWGIFMLLVIFESVAFACVMLLLITSLTADKLQSSLFWDLGLWKWCLLMFAILCGRLIAQLITKLIMFLIWRFWVHEKVLYFAYGVRKSFMFFIWVGLVGLAWGLIANHGVDRSKKISNFISNDMIRGIAGCLIGALLWLMKILLVKLVGSIHATKLLDKIQEAIGIRKLLMALLEMEKANDGDDYDYSKTIGESIDAILNKLFDKFLSSEKIERDNISRETMKELIYAIRGKRLLCLPHGDEKNDDGDDKKPDEAAKETCSDIFSKLPSDTNNGERCISLESSLQHVKDKKVIDQLKGLAETKTEHDKSKTGEAKIEESIFRDWLVEVYREHDSLNSTLKHSKTAIDELNVIASVVVLLIIIIMWLLFMEFLTTKLLVFLSSQILLVAFMFSNTVKTVFEAVLFVFLVHPFDVGDRCVIEGVQMVVDEMSILTTTFLRYDNEKIYYPNAVLASKPISNLYRSPPMSEIVEFAISLHTPPSTIEDLREKIKTYLESNPRSWRPDHSLQFREIEDVNKMKVALFVNHTINFHYIGKRMKRRSELVLKMKDIFEELNIEYRLLPQRVDITSVKWSASTA